MAYRRLADKGRRSNGWESCFRADNGQEVTPLHFTHEPLSVIIPALNRALQADGLVAFNVPDPDSGIGLYAGEVGAHGIHRPWSAWADLADALDAHFLTAERLDGGWVRLRYRAYAPAAEPDAGGYDTQGDWVRVNKLEDPIFLLTFVEALRRVNPPSGGRILALGVNGGHELDALALAFPERDSDVVGVDINTSALGAARTRFPSWNFVELDVNALPQPELGQFDLIIALSLLQSPGVTQDVLLAALRKHHITPSGGFILGFPNARYRDGHLSYGARMRNFARPDLSLLCADVTNARRGLQKQGYKVFVTGKYEVLVTAIPAEATTPKELGLWALSYEQKDQAQANAFPGLMAHGP